MKVVADKKVIVDLEKNGTQKTVDWNRGTKLKALPRFKAGIASATMAVAPVTVGTFTVSPANINCGQTSTLNWSPPKPWTRTSAASAPSPPAEPKR